MPDIVSKRPMTKNAAASRPSTGRQVTFMRVVYCAAIISGHCCEAATSSQAPARPVVAVAKVQRGELYQQASFDAELRPYREIELHARVTGYLDKLNVDAGDIVKEDQLIATLDVPDLKSEIDHALASERRSKADIEKAKASYEDAHLALTRLAAVDKAQPSLIAPQDIDVAKSKDRVAAAALDAAEEQGNVAAADVKKLHIMEAYANITAPFEGAITKRYSDPGALIQAGTSTGSMPLVRLSQLDKLRAVFPVSVAYVSGIKVGDPVQIHIDSTLNRIIPGIVARFSRKVETSTRTMEVEVDVPNTDLSITPGIYATARVKVDEKKDALSVPIEAISRNKSGSTIFFVTKEGVTEERPVKLGIETPDSIEILSGASEGELVVVSGRTELKDGEIVEPFLSAIERPPAGRGVIQTAKSN
jgi:RND family efflux transporter MFP subunit